MHSLFSELRGQIDLIYIDPPFNVGADFTADIPIGEGNNTIEKEQSLLEAVAYSDIWGKKPPTLTSSTCTNASPSQRNASAKEAMQLFI